METYHYIQRKKKAQTKLRDEIREKKGKIKGKKGAGETRDEYACYFLI